MKNNISTLVLKGMGCRLKVYVQVHGVGDLKRRNFSLPTLFYEILFHEILVYVIFPKELYKHELQETT